jgi:hypothetical protein
MMDLILLRRTCLCIILILFVKTQFAQQVPIGQWQTHFCYNSALSIAKVKDKLFVAKSGLYSYSLVDKDYSLYSKVNGLSDVNVRLIRYDESTDNLVIVYENGNIDLMQGENIVNLPDIKNLNITGSKLINTVYFNNKLIYLCTDFGIVVLNPEKREVKESYILQESSEILKIKGLTSFEGQFYAATPNGIFKASESNPRLQDFASWNKIVNSPTRFIFNHQDKLFCATDSILYSIEGDTLSFLYETTAPIVNIRQGANNIYLCERSFNRRDIMVLNQDGLVSDSIFQTNPNDLVEIHAQEVWIADEWEGLVSIYQGTFKELHNPNGIYTPSVYKLSTFNNDVFVCAGGEGSWNPSLNSGGISRLVNGEWKYYNRSVGTPSMDSVIDILDVALDKRNNYLYAASYGGGLLEIRPDNTSKVFKNNGYIQGQIGNPGSNLLVGLAFDEQNNLWMSNYSAPAQMVVKKADGSWQNFEFPYSSGQKPASDIVIDNANQKWMIAPRGIGLFVLNDNNTIDNKNDDKIRFLSTNAGNGNLPNNELFSIVKDKNGKIWVGTNDGIAIFNCPESVTSDDGCDAELKIVKYDLNAGLLFQREAVSSIAVDGANNKWIGTNNGVWLISDDAERIIFRFTKDNSPLPSNEINSIAIQPNSGEVFIATNAGLVSFRGNAIEGKPDNSELVVFPNPVPSNYNGNVAVSGLIENADVRITDVTGQLVYRTKAEGGQAVWNGKNYTGQKPRTGVYYVFVTNTDGTETKVGKFIYNE